jgi:hypothetical protein
LLVGVVVVDWLVESVGGAAEIESVDAVAILQRDDVDVVVVDEALDFSPSIDGDESSAPGWENALLVYCGTKV